MGDDKTSPGLELPQVMLKFYGAVLSDPKSAFQHTFDALNQVSGAMTGSGNLEPPKGDKRFGDPIWTSNPTYRLVLQSYLAWCRSSLNWVEGLDLGERDKDRARLLMATMLDTLAPTNSVVGNPAAMKKTLETGGSNLVTGMRHFVDDMLNNHGMPAMVDRSKFKVGENLATTPGKVVHTSDILELIQYAPQTEKVHGTPIMIVPPQINKFYVWDLAPGRSLIEFLIQQGFTVFAVSWRNPSPEHAAFGLQDYVTALDAASEVVLDIGKSKQLHLAGACSGGITTSTLLGYWAARGIDRARSVTLLVTILDTDGVRNTSMGLFTNLETLSLAKALSRTKGVVNGTDLAKVFAWLRPNDLIWSYWVNNYLLGNEPPAFDILYWNSDTTRMTAQLHSDYVALMEQNGLTRNDSLTILGEPIDLKKVTCDAYILAGSTDHITPWDGCYRSVNVLGGRTDYVLSTSGHVQAIVNPPTNPKAKYRVATVSPTDPDAFLEASEEMSGSWWGHWTDWLAARSDAQKAAPKSLGNKTHMPTVPAPGRYVMEREA